MTASGRAALLAAACLLLASCSGGLRLPRLGPASAQADLPGHPPQADPPAQREQVAVPEPPDAPAPKSAFEPEPAAPPEVAALPEDADLEIPFDPEEPAVSDEEVTLLEELIELTLPEAPRVLSHEEALLHTRSELPLVMNEHVQRLITYFTTTTRGKATYRVSTGRGAAFRAMILRILEEEDVPAEIYYLAMAESGFRPTVRSHARATGMWQFMSSRGKQYGLRQDRYVDLRYDPETATRAAARHLKDLHIEFEDWYLAMAAYNCGPNRVKSAIRRTGSRDYWTLVRRRALPRETRNYVPIILAMTYVGENIHLFDLGEMDPAPEFRYDTVRTDVETSFALIADATGSTVETIKQLNHPLLRSATPPYGYDLRLPQGSGARFEREMALVPADKRLQWRRHAVRDGETLEAFAKRYRVDAQTLASLNSLSGDVPLEGGARLTVPTTTKLAIYRYYGAGAGGLLEPGTGRYRIASGDTLGGIARRFRTTVSTLMTWNGLSSTRIRAGRYLIVQPEGATGTVAVASGAAPTGRYTVRRGDSLSAIGARVGASVSQLRAWNGIRGSTIHAGQSLKVPGPPATASAGIASASSPPPSSGHYRIRSGDTLSTIGARFGVSIADLRSWNNLRSSRITAGKFLLVRRPSASATPSSRPAQPAASERAAQARSSSGASRYTVRRGDTLGGIAERFGTTAAKLRAWNGIRGSTIHPGQSLRVSAAAPVAAQSAPASGRYTVRRGDTLGGIAERFDTTAARLRAWNGIRGSTIHPGQTLTVGGSAGAARSYVVRRGDTLAGIAKRFSVSVSDLKRWNRLPSSRIIAGKTLVIQPSGS